ncbi:MAG TPA: hypothetical protein VMO00_02155 [Methylomirabilota bacterium]|nr:hypothetical protein [Methylomirabilota bacterium]
MLPGTHGIYGIPGNVESVTYGWGRRDTASGLQYAANRRPTLVKHASGSKNRVACFVPSPKLLA